MPSRIGMFGWTAALAAGVVLALSSPAGARPQYAAREGKYCVACHVDPAGGGLRNGNGFNYARGRHAWDVEPKFEEWKVDPQLAKGVRVGADLRYQGMGYKLKDHYDEPGGTGSSDSYPFSAASYAMQGALYVALQPVEPLTIYYSHDVAASSMKQRDWWGMYRDPASGVYVKAGQIRPPYGLRLDDHTPFVRGSRLSPPGEVGMEDVNPRLSLPGVEVGLVRQGFFVHAAYQDPGSTFQPVFAKLKEKMVGGKAGVQSGNLIVGVSGRLNGLGDGNANTKSRRFGGFASYGGPRYALLGEADAGTDQVVPGTKDKVRGGYLAGEFYATRAVTVRAEMNYMDVQDDASGAMTAVARRAGAGAEITPVPFLRVAAEVRRVSNSNAARTALDETWTLGYAVFSF